MLERKIKSQSIASVFRVKVGHGQPALAPACCVRVCFHILNVLSNIMFVVASNESFES